ncbi:Dynein light chain 2, cytoplasmic [Clonorchis sinensis]|uniref:Dynein light chain 2, cytoplasmic n=2 Tax=Clonorchis sinensis TaxID=79923 RepID=A0A8T1MYY8_CLOSI|nr:Dynein light chain 2, cytoplasmic [Clonorchis sinensis]GAA51240.1 dynein light chain LC8-type [Clonorchis sinensis]
MTDERAVVKNADMPKEMLSDALDMCARATEKYGLEKDIAGFLKKEMDRKYGPTWHCVVGQQYGSYVTHEANCFAYFFLGQSAVLLFKFG